MQRLTDAANHGHSNEHNFNNNNNNDKSKMTSMQSKSHIGEKSVAAVSHEEWLRKKEHEVKLKE